MCKVVTVAAWGSWDRHPVVTETGRSKKSGSERKALEGAAIEGESPVREVDGLRDGTRVPRDTWNPVGIWEDHLPRLNTT